MDKYPAEVNQRFDKDEGALLHIFPAEVWNIVFANCNSETTSALNNSSLCFRHWLLQKRTVFLFPQVLKAVEDSYIKEQQERLLPRKKKVVNVESSSAIHRLPAGHPIVPPILPNLPLSQRMIPLRQASFQQQHLLTQQQSLPFQNQNPLIQQQNPLFQQQYPLFQQQNSPFFAQQLLFQSSNWIPAPTLQIRRIRSENPPPLAPAISLIAPAVNLIGGHPISSHNFQPILQNCGPLRLVCKTWCHSIDSMILKHYDDYTMDPKRNSHIPIYNFGIYGYNWNYKRTYFDIDFDFLEFEQKYLTGSAEKISKYLGRTLEMRGWSKSLFSTLEKIGHNVLHCTIRINDPTCFKAKTYLYIRNALNFPNLKYLEIRESYGKGTQILDSILMQKLANVISENPINQLKNLEILKTTDVPSLVFNELLRNTCQLKKLIVHRNDGCGNYNIFAEHLPALERLDWEILKDSDLEELCLPSVDWKLTKLRLNLTVQVGNDKEAKSFNWTKLFELLQEKWKDTKISIRTSERTWEGLGKDSNSAKYLCMKPNSGFESYYNMLRQV